MATTVKPSDKVRIGIIGCGGIATGTHLPALHKLSNIEMVAFCDLIPRERSRRRRTTARPTRRFTKTTRNCLRTRPSTSCMFSRPTARTASSRSTRWKPASTLHVRKKPMAINAEEAKKMVDAAKRTGKKLTIGYQNRQRNDSRFSPRRRSRPARSAKSTTRERPHCAAERCRLGACSSTSTSRAAVR